MFTPFRKSSFLLLLPVLLLAQKPASQAVDPLGREDPRSTVTAFLEACQKSDYDKAAQYLDLSRIPSKNRAHDGPVLAKDLEAILNSDNSFDVLRLSMQAQGNPADSTNPTREQVTSVTKNGHAYPIELEHLNQPPASPWVFSSETVAEVPALTPTASTQSAIEARLPRFLVTVQILDTALWKWLGLLLVALVALSVFRLLERLLTLL